ncbi:MAG: FHA domain-containing protein [Coriobacteriia bacterium]|nr:FHA domain-containing protein [Coriobacteriia bacterium]
MIDVILLAGRIVLVVLLYIFLLFAAKTGVGLVRTAKSKKGTLTVVVIQGPTALLGTTMPLTSALVIGRAEGTDIFINDPMVSSKHARITPVPSGAILEDLNSTNGTLLNGMKVTIPAALAVGDQIAVGNVMLEVGQR